MNFLTNPGEIFYSRMRIGLIVVVIGMLIFLIGAKPGWFGVDRSPVVGFIQITVFLIGLGILCVGGYVTLSALWGDAERSILADIGMRLISTGYVVAVFAGMADIFGLGSQPLPEVPHFGVWQSRGVMIAQIVIAIGFLFSLPLLKKKR